MYFPLLIVGGYFFSYSITPVSQTVTAINQLLQKHSKYVGIYEAIPLTSEDEMEFYCGHDIISSPPVISNSLTTQQTDWWIDGCLLWQPLRCLSNMAVMTAGDYLFAAVTFCLLSSCPLKISFLQKRSRKSAPSSLQRCGLSIPSSGFICVCFWISLCVWRYNSGLTCKWLVFLLSLLCALVKWFC